MFSKLKIKQNTEIIYAYVNRLRDMRFAGQVLFVVIVLLVSWSGVKAIDTNYSLEKQISTIQQQDVIQRLEDNNLQLQNQYYNSNQYLELSARQNFGLAASGETELIVPQNVALSYTAPEPKTPVAMPASQLPFYERNFQAWIDFFLHRPLSTD